MTHLLLNPPESLLEDVAYRKHCIDSVIMKVHAILEKTTGKQFDYYDAMHQTLIALSSAITKCDNYHRAVENLKHRIEILEMALAAERRAKVA